MHVKHLAARIECCLRANCSNEPHNLSSCFRVVGKCNPGILWQRSTRKAYLLLDISSIFLQEFRGACYGLDVVGSLLTFINQMRGSGKLAYVRLNGKISVIFLPWLCLQAKSNHLR